MPKPAVTATRRRKSQSSKRQLVRPAQAGPKQSLPAVGDTPLQPAPASRTATPRSLPPTAVSPAQRLRARLPAKLRAQPRGPIKHPTAISPSWIIMKQACSILWNNRILFLGITGVYLVLSIVLVKGISMSAETQSLRSFLAGSTSIGSGLLGFALLVTGSNTNSNQITAPGATPATNPVGGVYQILLGIIVSLAIVWELRQAYLETPSKVRIREAFYRGMYPLVPVILVLLTIGLQLLPMVLGAGLYSMVVSTGIAGIFVERLLWGILSAVLASTSFYMLISSIFGLYVVTLPDMTPLAALRSARDLVRYQRWRILRKLLFLPFVMLVVSAVIMLPFILFLTPVAAWVFFGLTLLALPFGHAYMYSLYRELLR